MVITRGYPVPSVTDLLCPGGAWQTLATCLAGRRGLDYAECWQRGVHTVQITVITHFWEFHGVS